MSFDPSRAAWAVPGHRQPYRVLSSVCMTPDTNIPDPSSLQRGLLWSATSIERVTSTVACPPECGRASIRGAYYRRARGYIALEIVSSRVDPNGREA